MKINKIMNQHRYSTEYFGLPKTVCICQTTEIDINNQSNHDQIDLLNDDQKKIFEHVIKAIEDKKGRFIFVDGPAGTGKTFLYKQMITFLESNNKKVIKCATTGIAADLIDGRTLHSVFKLPIPIFENCTSRLKKTRHMPNEFEKLRSL